MISTKSMAKLCLSSYTNLSSRPVFFYCLHFCFILICQIRRFFKVAKHSFQIFSVTKTVHRLLIFLLDHLLYYCIQYHFRQMENNKINKTGNSETVQPKKEDANCSVLAAISSFWVCSITTIFISKHLLDVCFFIIS